MSAEVCRRCASAALVATSNRDGTETVVCSTCGRRFTRVMAEPAAPETPRDPWWAE